MLRVALSLLLVASLALSAVNTQESAVLWGMVFDGAGNPTPGYAVVIQEAATGATWTSPPSNPAGQFELPVATGGSYRSVGLVSPSGARFTLDPGIPVQARRPVRYRIDVRLPESAPAAAATSEPARGAAASSGADDRAPWWKSPAGIVSLVAIQGAVLAVILMNGDDESSASPSSP